MRQCCSGLLLCCDHHWLGPNNAVGRGKQRQDLHCEGRTLEMGHKWVPACKTPTPTERSNALAPSTHAAVALWVAHNHCHTIMMPMGATTVARCLCGYMHCSMERRPAACRRVCAARGSTTSGWHQPCHLRARCMCVGSKLPVAAGPGEGSTGSITTAMVPTYVSQAHVLAAAAAHHWAVGCSLPGCVPV